MQASFSSGLTIAVLLSMTISPQASASTECDTSFSCATHTANAAPTTGGLSIREHSPTGQTAHRNTSWPVLTFQGLEHLEQILTFYAGGLGSAGSGPGPDFGIAFSNNALAVISVEGGATGQFTNNPSGFTTMSFKEGTAATLNVPDGFEVGFSFYYSAAEIPGEVVVYDGLDGNGNVLATIHLPVTPTTPDTPYLFDNWQPRGVAFSGVARSVDFGGATDRIGFDNITIGTDDPDGLFHDRFEP